MSNSRTLSHDNDGFIGYWNAVDAALQHHFATDTFNSNIGAGLISDSYDASWTPEEFAFWCGENYSLPFTSAQGA